MAGSDKRLSCLARKLLLFIVVIAVSYFALLYLCSRDYRSRNSYLAAQIDKMELLKKTESPRLILIGGSNLSFSIDSARLSQAMNVPVVNMGLNAGFGLKYMLDSAKPLLRKGDFVVIVPEYEQFVGELFEGDENLLYLFFLTRDVDLLWRIKPANILAANITIFRFKPATLLEAPDPNPGGSFNRYGDEVAHLTMANVWFNHSEQLDHNLNHRAIGYLADFMRDCEIKGSKTVFLFPCLMRANHEINSSTISRIETALRQRIPDMAPLSATDFVYDDRYFFNTTYHMNAEGRKLRTEKMIQVLDGWMKTIR